MTIKTCLEQIEELKPSNYGDYTLIAWLSNLDNLIYNNIISRAVHPVPLAAEPAGHYGPDVDQETELLAPEPYDAMYIHWLSAQIDLADRDYDAYNTNIIAFQHIYDQFAAFYVRTHESASPQINFF